MLPAIAICDTSSKFLHVSIYAQVASLLLLLHLSIFIFYFFFWFTHNHGLKNSSSEYQHLKWWAAEENENDWRQRLPFRESSSFHTQWTPKRWAVEGNENDWRLTVADFFWKMISRGFRWACKNNFDAIYLPPLLYTCGWNCCNRNTMCDGLHIYSQINLENFPLILFLLHNRSPSPICTQTTNLCCWLTPH